jgi:hypothetical protein
MLRGVLREEAADDGGGEGGGAGAGGGAAAPDPAALQAEIERLKADIAEKDTAARYWHDAAQKAAKGPDKPAAVSTTTKSDDEEDIDPIELLSKEGSKGLDKLLAKRGFVRADDVDRKIETRAQVIATENALATEYPDLKDANSDFFKATAVHYKGLVDAGMPQHLAMKFAAEKAELEGYKSGKRLTKADKEEREARAKAQAGDKGSKKAEETEESSDLDAFQKYICEQMEITPEQYKKRAKDGVVVTGGR